MHLRNAAEISICNFRNHFVARLTTTDLDFLIRKWGRLLDQSVIILNLLWNSRVNPKLSAYASTFEKYYFNISSMAPPATRVGIHYKPDQCTSWCRHVTPDWYIVPLLENYFNMKCYMIATETEQFADTLQFFTKTFKFLSTTT